MNDIEFLIALLAAATVLVRLADALAIPYPIILVLAGLAIGLIPGIDPITLDPDVIFLVFLPPLIYSAGFAASPRELRAELRSIGGLVLGLAMFTAAGVGVITHLLIPQLDWGEALLLGAIVAPTDPVAAIATFGRVGVPERVALLVEGESLVNDATALVAYRVILGGVLAGAYEVSDVVSELTIGVAGGIAIGLAIGWLTAVAQRRLEDPPLAILLSVVAPFVTFTICEEIGASGVLSVVASGLYIGWRSHEIFDADTRLNAIAFWQAFVFGLNAILFVLLGLQFPDIIEASNRTLDAGQLVGYALLVSAAVIAIRLAWQFLPPLLMRISPFMATIDTGADWRERIVVGWSGMRGAVSLAAALALPLTLDDGSAFANRDLIICLTVATIIATLVVQGLTLPMLVRKLGVTGERPWSPDEAIARLAAAQAALDRLDEIESHDAAKGLVPEEAVERLRELYRARFERCMAAISGDDGTTTRAKDPAAVFRHVRLKLIAAERAALLEERNSGGLRTDVFTRIQRELDIDEARMSRG
ncbi:Na+/H+ antiporter [soil metagenome]